MNKPVTIEDNPPRRWLTIPEVCAYLKVSEADWNAWRAAGDTPLHLVTPDGQAMVRASDLARWLDARTVEPTAELTPADVAEVHTQRARVAPGPRRRVAWICATRRARRRRTRRPTSWLRRIARRRSGRDGQS
jgi:hypothetical protein